MVVARSLRLSEIFETKSLAENNKKRFGAQRTFDTGHTDLIEQSSLTGGGRRLKPTKQTEEGRPEV
jgi:hypothetical protein